MLKVKLENFEGPMDLLIHLIEKNKIDIYDIPIALLTEEYMKYTEEFEKRDMDSMSEFILMAATLIEIKSKMLLPKEVNEDGEEIDPREELVQRLIEYKKYKLASEKIGEKQTDAGKNYFKSTDESIVKMIDNLAQRDIDDILYGADIQMLYSAFEEVLKRQELKVDTVRSQFNSVSRDLFTVEDRISHIKNLLKNSKKIKFFKIFDELVTKQEVVVTFLAMLELIKEKQIKVIQKNNFDDITISSFKED